MWGESCWQIDECGTAMRLANPIAVSLWMDAKDCLTQDVVEFAVATCGFRRDEPK